MKSLAINSEIMHICFYDILSCNYQRFLSYNSIYTLCVWRKYSSIFQSQPNSENTSIFLNFIF